MHLPIYSTCLYLQLYCTSYSTDLVFETFKSSKILSSSEIDHWYFIRYNVPQDHLRLRVFITDEQSIPEVQKNLKVALSKLSTEKVIYDITQNSYKPEYIRYGKKSFSSCERLFSLESALWLNIFHLGNESIDRISYGILKLYCKQLGIDLQVLTRQFEYYSKEFNILNRNKIDFKSLHESFNSLTTEEAKILSDYAHSANALLEELASFQETSIYASMVTSIIHMLFNRFYTENQRVYEAMHLKLVHKELIRNLYSKTQTT